MSRIEAKQQSFSINRENKFIIEPKSTEEFIKAYKAGEITPEDRYDGIVRRSTENGLNPRDKSTDKSTKE